MLLRLIMCLRNDILLDEKTKNTTPFWRTLKTIFSSKPKSKGTNTTFKINVQKISNKEAIAIGLSQIFSIIATTLLQNLHPLKDFVWNKSNVPTQTTQKYSFRQATPSENCICLIKLRRKKTHLIDELPPNLLKDISNEISKPLAIIINKSLLLGIVPDLWKI